MQSPLKSQPVKGLHHAVVAYGKPAERSFSYQVNEATYCSWESTLGKRVAEVVLLLRRRNGRFLVHTKAFYPKGVYRLLSGGIKPGEDLLAAAQREALEETGLDIRIERFLGILHHRFAWRRRRLPFTSYLFLVAEEGGVLRPNDQHEAITGFQEITLAEMVPLAEQLESLSPDWRDWGRFRATAHRFVAEVLWEHHD